MSILENDNHTFDNTSNEVHKHQHHHEGNKEDISNTHSHLNKDTKTSLRDTIFTNENLIFIVLTLIILIATVYLRIELLQYQGFYEPDGFYHFSVIRAAVNNNFVIPKTLVLSGWPVHTLVTEPIGLYWVTLFPYFILRFFGVSYYDVMRLVPLLFAIFDVLGAYYLSRFLSKDKLLGLLVMAMVALSAGDAARTSALIYRGDGFVTAFLLLSLIFIAHLFKTKNRDKKIAFMLLAALSLSICNVVWNGASFADAIIILSFIVITGIAFIYKKGSLYNDMLYLIGALILWILLVSLYRAATFFYSQALTGIYFIGLLIMMIIGWFIGYLIDKRDIAIISKSTVTRAAFVILFGVLVGVLILIFFQAFIQQVFVNNGFITTGNTFAQTIQELTPPTYPFLFASFGISLFTTPMSILVVISSLVSNMQTLIWLIILITFIPYLFMNVYDSGSWLKGNARFRFDIKPEMLLIIVYFAVTAYLQLFAIRFNSLVSIPLAIMSAFTIYWFISFVKNIKLLLIIGLIILVAILLATIYYDIIYGGTITQADNINPQFLTAAAWLKNNTAPNSVILTLWPDGSVVEGWGNRTSVTDSVGSQNATKADPFAAWVFNSSDDVKFLTSTLSGSPNYLLVRYNWLLEGQGIYTESNLSVKNEQNYSFGLLIPTNESALKNGSQINFISQGGSPRVVVIENNSLNTAASFINIGNGITSQNSFAPLSYTAFYNENTLNYTIVNDSRFFNKTVSSMALVIYSNIPRYIPYTNTKVMNVTEAFIFNDGMGLSNMMKFLYFCNNNQGCTWNNKNASLTLVFINGDTRIYKINYNYT